jgi:hypothetical protein
MNDLSRMNVCHILLVKRLTSARHAALLRKCCQIRHYFIGEKSVGRMYVESIFSTSLLACSDLITS